MTKAILFVEPLGAKYGTQVVLLDLIRGLNREEFMPYVAFLNAGPFEEELRHMGISTFVLRPHRVRELHRVASVIYQLVKIIYQNNIQIVHGNGSMMLFYGGLAARLAKRPFIWHVYDPHTDDFYGKAFIRVQRHFHPSWTIFGTPRINEYYLSLYSKIDKYSDIFPGVDAKMTVLNADADRGRTSLKIPLSSPIISMFARLQYYKGCMHLVEAAALIIQKYPEAYFVLCGGSQPGVEPLFPQELQEKIILKKLEHRVILTGYVSDSQKKDILAASTIVVHPALIEPFGISIIEGMAASKPIVATDCLGPLITVSHGKTGMIVPRGSIEKIAEAIFYLLNHPQQARKMGERGKQKVEKNYTISAMVKQIEEIYNYVLKRSD